MSCVRVAQKRWWPLKIVPAAVQVCLAAVLFVSCSKSEQTNEPELTWVDPATLRPGPVHHERLTEEQTRRISAVHATLSEVESTSLSEWIEDFKRDANPDREIEVWEAIAESYKTITSADGWSGQQKNELFKVLLLGTMGPADEILGRLELSVLSEREARDALGVLERVWNPR